MDQTSFPLSGIRVLDFSHAYAGPFCSLLLADLGADVVKLEPPDGDAMRSSAPHTAGGLSLHFAMHNRNKRSLRLNLRDPRGQELLQRLIVHFDVLVENYRPGVMDRLGCGYERISALHPGLIMLSLSGFGQAGPYAQRAADDKVVQAMSSFMDLTGEPDGPPTKVGGSPSDYIAALYGALALTSALLLRGRTGRGQYLDLSLLDSMVATIPVPVATYLANGTLVRRSGNYFPDAAADGLFPTADGYVYFSAGQDRQWANLCRALGREELIDREGYRTRADRFARVDEVNGLITAWTSQRTTAEIIALLLREGVACGEVNTIAQMVQDPQIVHRALLGRVSSERWGDVPAFGLPFSSRQAGYPEPTPPPEPGEHTREILGELLSMPSRELDQLGRDGVI